VVRYGTLEYIRVRTRNPGFGIAWDKARACLRLLDNVGLSPFGSTIFMEPAFDTNARNVATLNCTALGNATRKSSK
jgi:hypothetical protein